MTGSVSNQKLYTFYQYDPPRAIALNKPMVPRLINVPENNIEVSNAILFEWPVLYVPFTNFVRLPAKVKENNALMKFLTACSRLIPNDSLPEHLSILNTMTHKYDPQTSLQEIVQLAHQGFPPALHYAGLCSLYGIDHTIELDNPVNYFAAAAKNQYAASQAILGYMFEHGTFVMKNLPTAIAFYNEAMNSGSPLAFFLMGLFHEYDEDLGEKDLKKAAFYYREAIARHYNPAIFTLKALFNKVTNGNLIISNPTNDSPSLTAPRSTQLLPPPPPRILPQKRVTSLRTPNPEAKRVRIEPEQVKP